MRTDLRDACRRLEGRGYPAYRSLAGAWRLERGLHLFVDRVARDPFAPPSRVRLRVEAAAAGFDPFLVASRLRRMALADDLARRVERAARGAPRSGSGSSGVVRIDAGGQEVVERSAVRVGGESGGLDPGAVEARLEVGLPAAGRRILGAAAADLLTRTLPRIAREALVAGNLPPGASAAFVEDIEIQESLRSQLPGRGLVAFVADGAVLPRTDGASERPLPPGQAVPFESPPSLRVRLDLPGGGTVSGMGVSEGVTLIVGGGYHGKSTLLHALGRAVAPHVPGDGRERVVTSPHAVTIRAEEGRAIHDVDVSPFLRELPGDRLTDRFSTEDASGSTSQAAAIVEAVEAGARLLLLDEDTSATNLMIRDARMQALVSRDAEPIVPFLDRVRALHEERGVSTVLVMGGSGDYFDVADTVIQMADYRPREVTARAREIARALPTRRTAEPAPASFGRRRRTPVAKTLDPSGRKGRPRIRASRPDFLEYGESEVDLRSLSQLLSASQTRAAGHAAALAGRELGGLPVAVLLDELDRRLDAGGPDVLTSEGRAGRHPGRLARPRRHEVAAVLNRLRPARFTSAVAAEEPAGRPTGPGASDNPAP